MSSIANEADKNTIDKDTEITLTFKTQRAVVSPFGASLRQYVVETARGEWPVVWGYSGGANKQGGQGDVLVPFPGRIKNGTYEFAGTRHELVKNDKDGPNAIHGFLRSELFEVVKQTAASVSFNYKLEAAQFAARGYPFSLSVTITYSLNESGLTTSFAIKNSGTTPAPVGVGFHPYFRADIGSLENWNVQIPAAKYVELEDLIPTGRAPSVSNSPLDFRREKLIGDERFNACLAQLTRDANGKSHAILWAAGSKNRIVITMDDVFDYVVIYTGDQIPSPDDRRGFAIEPMTCAPDAFNHKGWGTKTLRPKENLIGAYTITAELHA